MWFPGPPLSPGLHEELVLFGGGGGLAGVGHEAGVHGDWAEAFAGDALHGVQQHLGVQGA